MAVFEINSEIEVVTPIKKGGQGTVYKTKRKDGTFSAVKVLSNPIDINNKEDKDLISFNSEVLKLKKVNTKSNNHVVKILNSGLTHTGNFPFVEMEFIDGPDLDELLKPPNNPVFKVEEVIKVAKQLAFALAHCHKQEVKHGDIKSNNIRLNLVTQNYVLLDFGMALLTEEQRRTSLQHAGAVEFMAPEQFEGTMELQTDIYSLGIVLFELLAGTVPYPLMGKGDIHRNNVMLAHLNQPVPDILSIRGKNLPKSWSNAEPNNEKTIPLWLLTLVKKCLEKNPKDRYNDGSFLLDDIIQHTELDKNVEKDQYLKLYEENIKLANENAELKLLNKNLDNASKEDSESIIDLNLKLASYLNQNLKLEKVNNELEYNKTNLLKEKKYLYDILEEKNKTVDKLNKENTSTQFKNNELEYDKKNLQKEIKYLSEVSKIQFDVFKKKLAEKTVSYTPNDHHKINKSKNVNQAIFTTFLLTVVFLFGLIVIIALYKNTPSEIYKVISSVAYLYKDKEGKKTRTDVYIKKNDTISAFETKDSLIYTKIEYSNGKTIEGWLRKEDLQEIEK